MSKSRDIADSAATINYIDNVTSDVQSQLNTLTTAIDNVSVTSGTLTKTFTTGESSTIDLTSSVLAPVVSVTKEVPQSGVTNNNWDVNSTTENYTRLNSAAATTLSFTASIASSSLLNSFSVGAIDNAPQDIVFNNDGTKMFIIGTQTREVHEYVLSIAFDISTAVYSQNFSVTSQDTSPISLCFNSGGDKLFVFGYAGMDVNEYTLSNNFDISTALYSQNFSVSSQTSSGHGVRFNTDGTKMFITEFNNQSVLEYTLSIGFNISTAVYSQSFSASAQVTTMRNLSFNNDGTLLLLADLGGDKIVSYSLSIGFDISTAVYSQSFSVNSQEAQVIGVAINANQSKIYIIGNVSDTVYSYLTGSSLELGTGSFASADVGKTIEANDGVFVLTATDGSYVETTEPTSYDQVASGSWEMYGVVYNAADGDLELSSVAVADPYNVTGASYSGNSFSVASQASNPRGMFVSNNGLHLYVSGEASDTIFQYALSSSYNISTASYTGNSFDLSPYDSQPQGIILLDEGTKFYVSGESGNTIEEIHLNTAYDLSTATHVRSQSISSNTSGPKGLFITADGTKLFVTDGNDQVDSYSMSTAYNVSTLSFVTNFSVASQDSFPRTVAFNPNGTEMYIAGDQEKVFIYSLSTGFDLSTASYTSTFLDLSSEISSTCTAICFAKDGSKLYAISNSSDNIFEYNMSTTSFPTGYHSVHTTDSIDTTYWTDINSMTADQAAGDGNVYYAISTDDRTTWTVIDNTDGERDIVRNNAGTWQYNSNGTYASETWVNATTNTELAALAEAMEGASYVTGFNLATAGNQSGSFSVAVVNIPNSIRFNTDGTKMFIACYSIDEVRQYSLSTAYDITTASYDSVAFSISVTAPSSRGMNFNADGSKMYIVDSSLDEVVEYDLSTGFDLSTASYNSVSFDISSELTEPQDIVFNNNGTKMYVIGFATDSIFQYSLSTAYDISTASYDSVTFSVASESSLPTSLYFSNDGLFLFVLGYTNTKVYQYNLTTAYDISTASYSGINESVAQEGQPRGLTFNNDGSEMYIIGGVQDTVYQYPIGTTTTYLNQMDKTQLDAVTDPNHIALGDDLDLSIIFNMTSGSTVPSSDGVAINYDANVLNKGAVLGTDYDFDAPAQDSVRITALAGNNLKVRVV